mgnify:CR=1 FL=1
MQHAVDNNEMRPKDRQEEVYFEMQGFIIYESCCQSICVISVILFSLTFIAVKVYFSNSSNIATYKNFNRFNFANRLTSWVIYGIESVCIDANHHNTGNIENYSMIHVVFFYFFPFFDLYIIQIVKLT